MHDPAMVSALAPTVYVSAHFNANRLGGASGGEFMGMSGKGLARVAQVRFSAAR